MAKKQFGRLFSSQKESKYRNEKVEYDGMTFDSKRERDRYIVLKDAERQGIISDLVCQPKFTLLPAQYHEETVQLKTKVKTVRKCDFLATTYTGDFQYTKDGNVVVEDVKISPKLIPKEFLLKEKMMLFFHKIRIRRVYKPMEEI